MALREKDLHTGLYTPGFLIAMGSRELSFARENDYPLSLITVNIRGLKERMDSSSDSLVDPALVKLGDRIREIAGSGAIVARVGDEEVSILLPGVTDTKASKLADMIHEILVSENLVLADPDDKKPVTFGVVTSTETISGFADLLKESRKAIYGT